MESIEKLKCKKCEHEWFPRNYSLPKACPNCNSRKWNVTTGKGE